MDSVISTTRWKILWLGESLAEVDRAEEVRFADSVIDVLISREASLFAFLKPIIEELVPRTIHLVSHTGKKSDIDLLLAETEVTVIRLEELDNLLLSSHGLSMQDVKDNLKHKAKPSKKVSAILDLNYEEMNVPEVYTRIVLEVLQQRGVASARHVGILERLRDSSTELGKLEEGLLMHNRPRDQDLPLSIQLERMLRGV